MLEVLLPFVLLKADHQRSKNEKETRKKGKCLDKTSTQTLQQL